MLTGRAGTLLRFLLWATLAVALLGMHHTPLADSVSGHSGGDRLLEAGSATTFASPVEAGSHEGCCTSATAGPAARAGERDGLPSDGHDDAHAGLLHLCAAIMAVVAGLALVLFVVARLSSAGSGLLSPPRRGGGCGRAPPMPTSRRLAVLCVLRQ